MAVGLAQQQVQPHLSWPLYAVELIPPTRFILQKLFETIIDYIASFSVTNKMFEAMKEQLQKAYNNSYLRPSRLVTYVYKLVTLSCRFIPFNWPVILCCNLSASRSTNLTSKIIAGLCRIHTVLPESILAIVDSQMLNNAQQTWDSVLTFVHISHACCLLTAK